MKSTVIQPNTSEPEKFPQLMIRQSNDPAFRKENYIVMMLSSSTEYGVEPETIGMGIIVALNDSAMSWKVGDRCDNFKLKGFRKFDGKIVLEND